VWNAACSSSQPAVDTVLDEKEPAHMFRARAYTIDSCYVGFAVAGRYPWVRSWWQWLAGR